MLLLEVRVLKDEEVQLPIHSLYADHMATRLTGVLGSLQLYLNQLLTKPVRDVSMG